MSDIIDFESRKNNKNNTPPKKEDNKPTVKEKDKEDGPSPAHYLFILKSGQQKIVEGYLGSGTTQIIIGDENGIVHYLVPLDQVLEVSMIDVAEDFEEE